MWKYEVYADSGGHYRWRLKASNGQTVASSGESFASQSNATRAAQNFKDHASAWHYEVYADTSGRFRWRAKAGNGQIVASSGESFASRSNAQQAADTVRRNGGNASGP